MYCKKIDSIRTKLTEEIHFEICHSERAAAVDEQHRRAAIEAWRAFGTVGVRKWGRNRAVKTNRLV